ncbi:hypothetical protein [Mycolicibacterium setense]
MFTKRSTNADKPITATPWLIEINVLTLKMTVRSPRRAKYADRHTNAGETGVPSRNGLNHSDAHTVDG